MKRQPLLHVWEDFSNGKHVSYATGIPRLQPWGGIQAVGILREEWAGACSKLKNLKPCGRCGVKPVWRIQPDSARVECPKCGNGFSDDSEYYEIGRLALKWTMSQSGQGDAYRLESMLNG